MLLAFLECIMQFSGSSAEAVSVFGMHNLVAICEIIHIYKMENTAS